MIKTRNCQYCKETFEKIEGRIFSNHVRWCEQNPKSKDTKNLKNAIKKACDKKYGEFKNFIVICHKCKKDFVIKERGKLFPQKEKYFCSKKCARSYSTSLNREEISKKVSEKLKGRIGRNQKSIVSYISLCKECGITIPKKGRKFCGKKCQSKNRQITFTFRKLYRSACAFNFNLKEFPKEFDFNLIREFGWYSASNRGNNLNGISRDHMISLHYGFEHKIDPKIISHPANCKLLNHDDNFKKSTTCSITLEILLERIKIWNDKYGASE